MSIPLPLPAGRYWPSPTVSCLPQTITASLRIAGKQWVTARRQAGVDEMLSQQGMEQAISVTMTDVDLYENNITLVHQ